MSRKIPIEKTIGGAYGFVVSNVVSIVGIVWLPLVLFGGLAAAAIWQGAIAHPLPPWPFTDQDTFDPEKMRSFAVAVARVAVPVWLCLIVAALMILTGLTRKALGLMEGPTLFYFNLGASFWRMFAAVFLSVLILVVFNIAFRIAAHLAAHFAAPLLPHPLAVLIGMIVVLVCVAIYIYAAFRLIFFLPAVVVAENRIGLARSWELGGGNFWRMILVLVAVLLPAAILFGIIFNVVLFAGFASSFPLPPSMGNPHPDPQQSMAYAHRVIMFLLTAARANWPVLLGMFLVYAITMRSLYVGAVAKAYRGVTDDAEPATVAAANAG